MSAVPDEILAEMERLTGFTSTRQWLDALPEDKRASFMATCEMFLRKRGAIETRLTYRHFHDLATKHFGFPFAHSSLNAFMSDEWPDLFNAQKQHWTK